jgi:hypothetical protein
MTNIIMEYNLETIQQNLKIKYLNNLINGCNKSNINSDLIQKMLNDINEQENDNYTVTEKPTYINETETCVVSEKLDYLYLKPWSKLTLIHKIIKIKEFVNNLDISNDIEKEILKNKLIDSIKDKKIKNKVMYDENKGKIITMSLLSNENGKYSILS